jgi:hypothetical protein
MSSYNWIFWLIPSYHNCWFKKSRFLCEVMVNQLKQSFILYKCINLSSLFEICARNLRHLLKPVLQSRIIFSIPNHVQNHCWCRIRRSRSHIALRLRLLHRLRLYDAAPCGSGSATQFEPLVYPRTRLYWNPGYPRLQRLRIRALENGKSPIDLPVFIYSSVIFFYKNSQNLNIKSSHFW